MKTNGNNRNAARWSIATGFALAVALGGSVAAQESAPVRPAPAAAPTLEETRVTMSKWIETQQIISKERKDWQQGREILAGRLELVKQEVLETEGKIKQAEAAVAESEKKKQDLLAENERLKAAAAQLAAAVSGMENEVKRLHKKLPEPVQTKLQPLFQRIPADPATTKVSIAERYQNVLGILNEVNKQNSEIAVNYEVRTLSDGKPAEVKVIYVGLAQAYYVSAKGEAGIGRPSEDGWKWESSKAIAADVLQAIEIIQGKHSPAFVPLPVKLQ